MAQEILCIKSTLDLGTNKIYKAKQKQQSKWLHVTKLFDMKLKPRILDQNL